MYEDWGEMFNLLNLWMQVPVKADWWCSLYFSNCLIFLHHFSILHDTVHEPGCCNELHWSILLHYWSLVVKDQSGHHVTSLFLTSLSISTVRKVSSFSLDALSIATVLCIDMSNDDDDYDDTDDDTELLSVDPDRGDIISNLSLTTRVFVQDQECGATEPTHHCIVWLSLLKF